MEEIPTLQFQSFLSPCVGFTAHNFNVLVHSHRSHLHHQAGVLVQYRGDSEEMPSAAVPAQETKII